MGGSGATVWRATKTKLEALSISSTTTTTELLVAPALVTTAAPSGDFMYPWGYLIIGLCIIAAIGLLAFMMLSGQPKKPKSTRAVKPIKAKEPPPPPPLPVVPLMAQQMMVQPTI